jgi:hypothetical protein
MPSPFDDLRTRRRSPRVPAILTGVVLVGLVVVQMGVGGPFFSFSSTRECRAAVTRDGHDLSENPVEAVVRASRSSYPCAEHVTIAPVSDPAAVRTGAERAVEEGGPLLVVSGDDIDPSVMMELTRLEPDRVTLVGLRDPARSQLEELEVEIDLADVDGAALGPALSEAKGGPVFLLDSTASAVLPAIEVVAAQTDGKVLVAEEIDLADIPDPTRLVIESSSALRLVGGFDPTTAWQVELVRSDSELPGGGVTLFPQKRLVGFYGTPGTDDLGVLGEQGPAETHALMTDAIAGYGADGVEVVPMFEIITTVASAGPGPDGDYSDEMSIETLQPWIDYAADNGIYVVLDLQSGRTDFLTQARRYESLLRLPHVGLALDPEWRLGPDQIHLEQIGTVDASEINAVSEWLAAIVREEVLPQKLFLVHQFRDSMITNREEIATPDELAVVLQMDGQGPFPTKVVTWNGLTSNWNPDRGYLWGWKNFYDEDVPRATPAEVLELWPVPVFISYQ